MRPLVSVIIVNHNGAPFLEDCLQSLETMNFPKEDLEILLVDNGSTDHSVSLAREKFRGVKVISLPENKGFAVPNNLAVREGAGEIVAFLNNDTRVHPEWLSHLVRILRESEQYPCVGSKMLRWNGGEIDFAQGGISFAGHGKSIGSGARDGPDFSQRREILFPCGGAMAVWKRVFLEAGGFDEDYFAYFEDVDFGWRLWVLGHKVALVPESIVFHRGGATSGKVKEEKKHFLDHRNALCTIYKNYDEKNLLRILPAALLANITEAVSHGAFDSGSYRMNGPSPLNEKGRSFLKLGKAQFFLREILGLETMDRKTASRLLAIRDFVDLLPRMQQKRSEIQRKRARSDEEIFPLFLDPLNEDICPNERTALHNVLDILGVRKIFEEIPCAELRES
ncbi:MAG: glycosyltransferase family 2 protein [Armatimonadetes bacterium]|nr:glycosyltransferase family 2 protein [Armatimonadota bacterium]